MAKTIEEYKTENRNLKIDNLSKEIYIESLVEELEEFETFRKHLRLLNEHVIYVHELTFLEKFESFLKANGGVI